MTIKKFALAGFVLLTASGPAAALIQLPDASALAGITCKLGSADEPLCSKNGKADPAIWRNIVQPWLKSVGYPKQFITSELPPKIGPWRANQIFYDKTAFEIEWRKGGSHCQTLDMKTNLKALDNAKRVYCQLWGMGIEINKPKVVFVSRKEHWELRKQYWKLRKEGFEAHKAHE